MAPRRRCGRSQETGIARRTAGASSRVSLDCCLLGRCSQSLIFQYPAVDKVVGSLSVPSVRPDPAKPNPKLGIIQLEWNADGTCLLVRSGGSQVPTSLAPSAPDPSTGPQRRSRASPTSTASYRAPKRARLAKSQ